MTMITNGYAKTESASRYLQQLCKHWSHRFAVEFTEQSGTIPFPNDVGVELTALPDRIVIAIHMPSGSDSTVMRGVVASHLDRFAFREAPLPFVWDDTP